MMKCLLNRASQGNFEKAINLKTIEDLEKLVNEEGEIIIGFNEFYKGDNVGDIAISLNVDRPLARKISKADYVITIYDDYIE